MSLTPTEVFARASDLAQDADNTGWPEEERIRWLNDGRAEIYRIRPEVYSAIENVTLVSGVQQELPTTAGQLFAPSRLLEARFNVAGSKRAITMIDEDALRLHRPGWRNEAESGEIMHVMYRPEDFGSYQVYPPAINGTQINIDYAKPPPEVTSGTLDTVLDAEGKYAPALIDYLAYRMFQKESDTNPGFTNRAAAHYASFLVGLGIQQKEQP
jgi:hypothetical protein